MEDPEKYQYEKPEEESNDSICRKVANTVQKAWDYHNDQVESARYHSQPTPGLLRGRVRAFLLAGTAFALLATIAATSENQSPLESMVNRVEQVNSVEQLYK